MDFAELNPIEQAFVDQSRREAENKLRILAALALVLLLVGSGIFFVSYQKVERANKALREERDKVVRVNQELTEANQRLQSALDSALQAVLEAESLKAELQKAQNVLEDVHKVQPASPYINPAEQVRRQDTISKADDSIANVKRSLTNQFGRKYKLNFKGKDDQGEP
jgi:hypothetical protein